MTMIITNCPLSVCLLFVLSVCLPCTALQKGLLLEPLNTAVRVGDNVNIACSRPTQSVAWTFTPVGAGQAGIIAVECRPIASVSGIYKIDAANGACNLIIDTVTGSLGGTYACQDLGSVEKAFSAELIVLEAHPTCMMNITTQGVVVGVPVLFTCAVKFSGTYPPLMMWKDELGNDIEIRFSNSNSSFVETGIVILAGVSVVRPVSCRTYFDAPPVKPPSPAEPAVNAPSYTFDWTSPLVATQYAKDCSEILTIHPGIGNGIYYLKFTDRSELVKVYCDMTTRGGGWTVFQRRIDGSVIFYRPWLDYFVGFGDTASEFWLGNEYLSILTSSDRHSLRVDLGDWSGQYRYAEYNDFKIANASAKYNMTVLGAYTGNAGNSLTPHRDSQFSTYDQDNGLSTENCALIYHGAWWYHRGCYHSSLNGEYNSTAYGEGVHWGAWLGYEYSLRFTEMKIRPVTF